MFHNGFLLLSTTFILQFSICISCSSFSSSIRPSSTSLRAKPYFPGRLPASRISDSNSFSAPIQEDNVGWSPDPNFSEDQSDSWNTDILEDYIDTGTEAGCKRMDASVEFASQSLDRFSFMYTSTDHMLNIYPIGELVIVQCSVQAGSSGIPLYTQDPAGHAESYVFGARFMCDDVSKGWIPAPFEPPVLGLKCFDLKASFMLDSKKVEQREQNLLMQKTDTPIKNLDFSYIKRT